MPPRGTGLFSLLFKVFVCLVWFFLVFLALHVTFVYWMDYEMEVIRSLFRGPTWLEVVALCRWILKLGPQLLSADLWWFCCLFRAM